MRLRITLFSDEEVDFSRELMIEDDSTFFDLQQLILRSCQYNDSALSSFYICNDTWNVQAEITREDMGVEDGNGNVQIMADTLLSKYLKKVGQKFQYEYDLLSERLFFMELIEIKDAKQPQPICTMAVGDPPKQQPDDEYEDDFNEPEEFEDLETLYQEDEMMYEDESVDFDEFENY